MAQCAPAAVATSLQDNHHHWWLFSQAQERLVSPPGTDAAAAIQAVLAPPPRSNAIRNAAHAWRHGTPTEAPATSCRPCQDQEQRGAEGTPLHAARAALQRDWDALVLQRLAAAQQLLSSAPLVSPQPPPAAPGTDSSQEAWERVGAARMPLFAVDCAVPVLRRLLYGAADLLAALTGTLTPAGPQQQQQQQAWQEPAAAAGDGPPASEPPPGPSLLACLAAPEWPWLQALFGELRADQRHVGVDDVLHPWYAQQQQQQACHVLSTGSAAAARNAARTGAPAAARPGIWAAALGVHLGQSANSCGGFAPPACGAAAGAAAGTAGALEAAAAGAAAAGDRGAGGSSSRGAAKEGSAADVWPVASGVGRGSLRRGGSDGCGDGGGAGCGVLWQPSSRDVGVLRLLCEAVEAQPLLVDALSCAAVQQLADDPRYFVFEDTMRAVLLAFSRDPSISCRCAALPQPCVGWVAGGGGSGGGGTHAPELYPPSGVLPHTDLAALVAPLCYVYGSHPALVYRLHVALYCRYWCRLTSWGGAEGGAEGGAAGLPGLCKTFLEVLQAKDPAVASHLELLRYPPLQVAVPWISSAFVGALAPGEVLALWDRVVGFDSLLVLPLLAAAVLMFRRDVILAAESAEELVEVMEDLTGLRVVPLLQALLTDS